MLEFTVILVICSVISQSPAKLMRIAQELIIDVATQAIYLVHIAELSWAIANDFSGFKAAIKEQVD
jgi:hypothetical protein